MADLSVAGACSYLGLSKGTVRALADAGELSSRRTAGDHRRFLEADLIAYRAKEGKVSPRGAARAAVWTAAALSVLRDAEMDLAHEPVLAERFRAAAEELRTKN